MIGIVVILVHGLYHTRCVDDWCSERSRPPDEPMVPPDPSEDKRRHIAIEPARKHKIIDAERTGRRTSLRDERLKPLFPVCPSEVPWLGDVCIPALANHEKSRKGGAHTVDRIDEARHDHDVTVDVAQQFVASQLLGRLEKAAQELGAKLILRNVRHVAKVKFAGHFRRADLVAERNDLYIMVKALPALYGVSLNDVDVPREKASESKRSSASRPNSNELRRAVGARIPRYRGGYHSDCASNASRENGSATFSGR
jgi:hypothetical protein